MTKQNTIVPSCHFPASHRLKSSSQFKQVLDKNQKIHGQFWILFYAENGLTPNRPRLGVIVSKKVSLLAVQRNRLKRIVRNFFRQQKQQMMQYDVVIIAKKSSIKHSKEKTTLLVQDLTRLTHKLKSLCNGLSKNHRRNTPK